MNTIKRLHSDHNSINSSIKKPKFTISNTSSIHIKPFTTPLISKTTGLLVNSIDLEPCKPYTIGRDRKRCDFVFEHRQVSKKHCQIYFDAYSKKVYIVDGVWYFSSRECSKGRVSLNGVFVDGVRVGNGEVKELGAGSEVSVVCRNEEGDCNGVRVGFVVEKIVFMEEVVCRNDLVSGSEFGNNAGLLLSKCRRILSSDDPVLYIRDCFSSGWKVRAKCTSRNRVNSNFSFTPAKSISYPVSKLNSYEGLVIDNNKKTNCLSNVKTSYRDNCIASVTNSELLFCIANNVHLQQSVNARVPFGECISNDKHCENDTCVAKVIQPVQVSEPKKRGVCVPPPGNKFYLNRLYFMDDDKSNEVNVTLPELLYPVETLERVFIATFTSDLPW